MLDASKINNVLLAIIAVSLLWIATRPNDIARVGAGSVIRTAAAQSEEGFEEGVPLEAICTLSHVEQSAARALVGDLQVDVVSALNETNAALRNMQTPLVAIQQLLRRAEGELETIARNTGSY